MKTLNLYIDFEFTSLSPDAQPISVGIVSDEIAFRFPNPEPKIVTMNDMIPISKSFYAEFTDFDLNRCDDWVKENVVGKLKYYGTSEQDKMFVDSSVDEGTYWGSQNTAEIKEALYCWLKQFSDYQIQIVVDCGTYDWYWFLQLVAEWDDVRTSEEHIDYTQSNRVVAVYRKVGLPKLPSNISPVPFDLNDLIAIKKGISPKEAFDLNREELASTMIEVPNQIEYWGKSGKHNALWDAKVIKEVYKLK